MSKDDILVVIHFPGDHACVTPADDRPCGEHVTYHLDEAEVSFQGRTLHIYVPGTAHIY